MRAWSRPACQLVRRILVAGHCGSQPVVAPTPENLNVWIQARLHEPCAAWCVPRSRGLPVPTNLPGMDKAAAAVLARYPHMPPEWHADVLQDFAVYLLRPASSTTIAASAIRGVQKGVVPSLERGIAWKLRQEILSRAGKAYKKVRREARALSELAAESPRCRTSTAR